MSAKRLEMLENHICGIHTQTTSETPLISSVIVTDGGKKYPEIIDYHPDKKVRVETNQVILAISHIDEEN